MKTTVIRSLLVCVGCLLGVFVMGVMADGMPFAARDARIGMNAISEVDSPMSGYGTPWVNGRISYGEWSAAARKEVFEGPLAGTVLYVMNDATNLYLALSVAGNPSVEDDSVVVRFDNANNGVVDPNDDLVQVAYVMPAELSFSDGHYTAVTGWSALDTQQDGMGNWYYDVEIAHPLNSGDVQDYSLSPGDIVGFCLSFFDAGVNTESMMYPTSCAQVDNEQRLYAQIKIAEHPSYRPIYFETQKLVASDEAERDEFGSTIAIEGSTAIIGGDAPYVFIRDETGAWLEEGKLVAGDGTRWRGPPEAAIDADTAVCGPAWPSAKVFGRDSIFGTWRENAILQTSDPYRSENFGWSVAIDDGTILVGDWGDYLEDDTGAVYVFVQDDLGAWNEVAKLESSGNPLDDAFGAAVSLDRDTALIGAPWDNGGANECVGYGAAYVFVRDDSGAWTRQAKLIPPGFGSNKPYCHKLQFGNSVDLDGDTAVIGAPGYSEESVTDRTGAVFVYSRDESGEWREQARLVSSDRAYADAFGISVAIDGDTIVAAAPGDSDYGLFSGSAYVFIRRFGVWSERAKLVASDGEQSDCFGCGVGDPVGWRRGVDVDGTAVIVGAVDYDGAGSAYVFDIADLAAQPAAGNLVTTTADANGNSSSDFALTTSVDNSAWLVFRDGVDGTAIEKAALGDHGVHSLATLADVSGDGLDEIMALMIGDDGKRVVRLLDSGDGSLVNQLPFGRWFDYPVALLALDNAGGGLAGRAVAVVQPDDNGRALAIVRDAVTGRKIRTVRYGLTIGTPIGAAVLVDIDGNAVEEIAVFGETAEGRARVQIRDASSGEKLATFGFDKRFRPLLVDGIPPINGDDSDELVVLGVNNDGAVRIEVKDSLSQQRLATRWLRRIEEETPLAMGYVAHPEGPALAVLTEGVDGKYRTRIKRLTSSEPGWRVNFPSHITPHDFAVMDDTSGNVVPELLVVGENHRGLVKALARDAETGEELFRTIVP